MFGDSVVLTLIASLFTLLFAVIVVVVFLHVWLRNTVGKFQSNVNFIQDFFKSLCDFECVASIGKHDWQNGTHHRW